MKNFKSIRCVALAFLAIIVSAGFGCTKKETLNGKVYLTVSRDNIKSADPTNAYDEVTLDVLQQIYETPYQYNYFADETEVIPLLADGMPEVSKDKLTYTIRLKKGIRFQDDPCFKASGGKGRELKAQDLVYGWKRHADPATESQGFWIWEGKIVGIDEFAAKFGKGRPAAEIMQDEVEGMKAIDDYTVQLKFKKPYPQLIYILTMTFTAPIPVEAITEYGKGFPTHPVGTGPFRATQWQPTSEIVLVKNENYRDDFIPSSDKMGPKRRAQFASEAGKKIPLLDAIRFTVVKEEQPRWLGFLKGKYDQIKIPKDNFDAAIENLTQVKPELAKKGVTVSYEPSLIFWYASMNTEDPIMKNKYLRQAIASSIDRDEWLKKFKNGRGSIQNEANPPAIVDRCGKPYRWSYDLARAKELIKKAGYPDGKGLPTLKWDTRNGEMTDRQIAEFVGRALAQIGIKLEINVNTFPAYLDKMKRKNLQMSKGGWNMDYPDAENSLGLLYGPNKSPGPNEANFDNPEFNKIFEKMALMPPGPERRKLICQLEEIAQEEAPWAYGIFENEYRLINKWLKNYYTSEQIMNKYKYLDVDMAAREQFQNEG